MIQEPFHIEIICSIKYKNFKLVSEDVIDNFIDKVKNISSLVTGNSEKFVLSSYKKEVSFTELILIINNYISKYQENIKEYKINILRYNIKIK